MLHDIELFDEVLEPLLHFVCWLVEVGSSLIELHSIIKDKVHIIDEVPWLEIRLKSQLVFNDVECHWLVNHLHILIVTFCAHGFFRDILGKHPSFFVVVLLVEDVPALLLPYHWESCVREVIDFIHIHNSVLVWDIVRVVTPLCIITNSLVPILGWLFLLLLFLFLLLRLVLNGFVLLLHQEVKSNYIITWSLLCHQIVLLIDQAFFVSFLEHLLDIDLVWLAWLRLAEINLKHCAGLTKILTHKLWHWSHWNSNRVKELFHHKVLLECINDRHVSSFRESWDLSF